MTKYPAHRSHPLAWLYRWRIGLPAVAAPLAAALLLAAGSPAMAQNQAICSNGDKLGPTQLRVSQQYGRALVEFSRPNSAGRKVEVDYGDESYIGQFDRDGKARLGFALTAAKNEIGIRVVEMPRVTCKIDVPEFNKIYRVVMRWRDPVQLDLHIVEPGAKLGDAGHVSPARPNTNLSQGIGQLDVISGLPADGATSETSYVVRDDSAIAADAVFSFRAEYVTRGMKPVLPYCDDGALASLQVDLIIVEKGSVTTSKLGTNRLHCGDVLPENRRLMELHP